LGIVCEGTTIAKGIAITITSAAMGPNYCMTHTNTHLKPEKRSTAPLHNLRYIMAPCKHTCEQVFMVTGDMNTLDFVITKYLREGAAWPCADAAKKAIQVWGAPVMTDTGKNETNCTGSVQGALKTDPEGCRMIPNWQQCGGENCEASRAAYKLQKCSNAPWEGVCCDEAMGFKCVPVPGTGPQPWWGCQK
jgi:hypothetical protein